MSNTIIVKVSIGLAGCKSEWDTGVTIEEWDKMTAQEQHNVVDNCVWNIIDVTIAESK